MIFFVNEEISDYKGIDFFLSSDANRHTYEAFQLLEFKARYSSVRNTRDLAQWIIDKKFKKGDKSVHLVVNVAPGGQMRLFPVVLRELLKESPFSSVVLFGPVASQSPPDKTNYILLGLNSFDSQSIINLESESIVEYTGECPYFNPNRAQPQRPMASALAISLARRKKQNGA